MIRYAPEVEKRWIRYEKPVGLSWRCDETYIKVAGAWTYLYRAVHQNGKTLDFFLSKRRDVRAAKTLFRHALLKHGDPLSITLGAYGEHLKKGKFAYAKGLPSRVDSAPGTRLVVRFGKRSKAANFRIADHPLGIDSRWFAPGCRSRHLIVPALP